MTLLIKMAIGAIIYLILCIGYYLISLKKKIFIN